MLDLGTLNIKIKADADKAIAGLESLEKTTEKVEKKTDKSADGMEDSWEDLGKAMKSSVSEGAEAASAAVDGLSDSAQKSEKDTEQAADNMAKSWGKLGGSIKTALAAGVAAAAAGIGELISIANESAEDMGKLNTAFEQSGFSIETANETYTEFVGLLGETDTAVEASNHLAKLCKSQEELSTWTDIAAGVFATFGDSLPLEGLTEAANETAKTGTVVGTLADALNWAGVSEDDFNQKLASLNTEQERSQLITETLNGLYKEAGDAYRENNAELIKYREAQAELNNKLAELGTKLMPLVAEGMDMVGDAATDILGPIIDDVSELIQWFNNLDEGTKGFIKTMATAAIAAKPLGSAIGAIKDVSSGAIDGFKSLAKEIKGGAKPTKALTKAFGGMGGALDMLAGVAIAAAVSAIAEATENTENYKKATDELVSSSEDAVSSISDITDSFGEQSEEVDTASDSVGKYARTAAEAAKAGAELQESISGKWSEVEVDATQLSNYVGVIEDLAGKTNLSASEQMALKNAVEQVNAITGSNIEVINSESGELSLSTEEIKKNTLAWVNNAKVKAAEESYTDTIKEQIQIESDLTAAIKQRDKIQQEVDDGAWWKGHELDEANSKIQHLEEQYDSLGVAAQNYIQIHESAQIEGWIGQNAELSAKLDEVGISYTQAADNIASFGLSAAEATALSTEQLTYLAQNAGESADTIAQKFADAKWKVPDSMREMLAEAGIAVDENGYVVVDSAGRVATEAANALDKKEEAKTKGKANIQGFSEGMSGGEEGGTSPSKVAGDTATAAVNAMDKSSEAKNKGITNVNAFNAGMTSKASASTTAGTTIATSANTGLGSQSGAAQTSGSAMSQHFNQGVGSNSGTAHSKGKSVASAAKSGMKSENQNSSSWGSHLVSNFAAGIRGAIGFVSKAASSVANTVKSILGHTIPKEGILNNGGKGEKPWGEHLVQNIAEGMLNAKGDIEDAANEIAKAAQEPFDKKFNTEFDANGIGESLSSYNSYRNNLVGAKGITPTKTTNYNFNVNGISVASGSSREEIAQVVTKELLDLERLARI